MKRSLATQFISLFSFALLLGFASQLQAQNFKLGPKFSVSSSGISGTDFQVQNLQDLRELQVSLQEASPEYHVGIFSRLTLLGFYIQPELALTTSRVSYLVEDLTGGGTEAANEQYLGLEMPIMAGIKLGPFRANAGPVYRMNLTSVSDLADVQGFGRRFQESTLGLQAGVGLDLGKKIVLDLRYETNLNRPTDEVTVFGQTHKLSEYSGQWVAGIGIAL